jgi:transposase InsO family protein
VIFEFIDAEKVRFPTVVLCAVLGVARSAYYAWRMRGPSARRQRDAELSAQIASSHARNRGVYGSPRIHADLRARGIHVSRKRVARLMRERRLCARNARRFVATTNSRHTDPIAPNVVDRDFTASAPNETWVADVTFVPTCDGWLYLAVILDLFARRVVGWASSETNDTTLTLTALNAAVRDRKPPRGLVHHSDRGSTYTAAQYRRVLCTYGIVASMSRSGDCWDNAVAESFFSTLKHELVGLERNPTRAVAEELIRDYIETFYNPQRRHSHVGYMSPIEFELRSRITAPAA